MVDDKDDEKETYSKYIDETKQRTIVYKTVTIKSPKLATLVKKIKKK